MKLVVGPVPRSRMFDPQKAGWTALREPTPDRFLVYASLLSVPILAPGLLLLPHLIWATWFAPGALVAFIVGLMMILLIHEVVHGFCYPGGLRSPHVYLGVWPSRLTFYANYDGPLSRNRFLLVLGTPTIVLTLLMLPAVIWAPSSWRIAATAMILIHLSGCTGDLLGILMVYRQVPRSAQVQNDGWQTYWKSQLQPVDG